MVVLLLLLLLLLLVLAVGVRQASGRSFRPRGGRKEYGEMGEEEDSEEGSEESWKRERGVGKAE